MSFTTLGYVALVPLFALAFIGAVTVAWTVRAAVRGWKRASRVLAAPLPPEDSDAMVSRWQDEPGKPDEVDAEIERWLTGGNTNA